MLTGPGATIALARKLRRKLTLSSISSAQARLAIEVDGEAHNRGINPARDEARDAWLMSQGYRTLRIAARDVLDNLEGVIVLIVNACRPLHHPSDGPPPRSGEEP